MSGREVTATLFRSDETAIAYQSERVTLFHGDALEVVLDLPSSSVDLIATDPPYGVSWQSNRRTEKFARIANDDGTFDVMGALGVALPTLKRGRHVYVFGPADLSKLPLTESAELIWDKGVFGSGDLTSPWGPQHERITFATYEISKANREKGYGRLAARVRRGSIVHAQRPQGSGVKRHPTEKPVALMRQLIESSTVLGETVLDPFAGSGSTLVAAVLSGRRAVGIELDEGYCQVAAERLAAAEAMVAEVESA